MMIINIMKSYIMKKIIIIVFSTVLFAACGTHPQTAPDQTQPSANSSGMSTDSSGTPMPSTNSTDTMNRPNTMDTTKT